MAFKLTKAQCKKRDALVTDLHEKGDAFAAAIIAFNEALDAVAKPLTDAAAAYNQGLESARNFASAIAQEARGAFDEKSDGWQEGDKGNEVEDWIQQWEEVCLD